MTHFRKQKRTAIAIDFLTLVIGVFVGIQVSIWKAVRQNRELASSNFERVQSDIELESAPRGMTIEYVGTSRAGGKE